VIRILLLVGAVGATRLMRTLLFGVSATDVTTFLMAPVVLGLVGTVACIIPAYRAAGWIRRWSCGRSESESVGGGHGSSCSRWSEAWASASPCTTGSISGAHRLSDRGHSRV
jgi:hypothetical protein